MASDIVLPLSSVLRTVAPATEGHSINKEGKVALQRAAAVTILYLTSIAGELCHESKRAAVNDKDVLRALEEADLAEIADAASASVDVRRKLRAQVTAQKKARLAPSAVSALGPPTLGASGVAAEQANEQAEDEIVE